MAMAPSRRHFFGLVFLRHRGSPSYQWPGCSAAAVPDEARGGRSIMVRHVCSVLLLVSFPTATLGDWTAIPLHPAGAYSTFVGGVSAQQQVGSWQATPF